MPDYAINNPGELKQAIIRALAFFDLFDHPLTAEELYRFLWQAPRISYNDFVEMCEIRNLRNYEKRFGFYFLPGREAIVETRRVRTVDNDAKLKIAGRAAKILRWVPFARAVFLCNNVAFNTADSDSDIDVLIIAKQGRIWITRLLATLLLSLFRLRRTKTKITNRICLSFYLSDRHLNLSDIAIGEPDIYLIYWLAQLTPLYDPDNLMASLISANRWVEKFLSNVWDNRSAQIALKSVQSAPTLRRMFEIAWQGVYGNLVESQAKEIQLAKMRRNVGSAQNAGDTRVVVNDEMLKFHENDRRGEYRERWGERINDK